MKILSIIISFFLFYWCILSSPIYAQEANVNSESMGKIDDIRTLMKITQSSKLVLQILDHTIKMYKKTFPEIPDQFWQAIRNEVDENELINLMIPIYSRHLNHKEIRAIIKFYQSPAGIKLIKITPILIQEAIIAGQTWGHQLGEKIKKRLKEKGYVNKHKKKQ